MIVIINIFYSVFTVYMHRSNGMLRERKKKIEWEMNCLVAKIIVWYFMRAWRKIAHAYYYYDDDGCGGGDGGRGDVDREEKKCYSLGIFREERFHIDDNHKLAHSHR